MFEIYLILTENFSCFVDSIIAFKCAHVFKKVKSFDQATRRFLKRNDYISSTVCGSSIFMDISSFNENAFRKKGKHQGQNKWSNCTMKKRPSKVQYSVSKENCHISFLQILRVQWILSKYWDFCRDIIPQCFFANE